MTATFPSGNKPETPACVACCARPFRAIAARITTAGAAYLVLIIMLLFTSWTELDERKLSPARETLIISALVPYEKNQSAICDAAPGTVTGHTVSRIQMSHNAFAIDP